MKITDRFSFGLGIAWIVLGVLAVIVNEPIEPWVYGIAASVLGINYILDGIGIHK